MGDAGFSRKPNGSAGRRTAAASGTRFYLPVWYGEDPVRRKSRFLNVTYTKAEAEGGRTGKMGRRRKIYWKKGYTLLEIMLKIQEMAFFFSIEGEIL